MFTQKHIIARQFQIKTKKKPADLKMIINKRLTAHTYHTMPLLRSTFKTHCLSLAHLTYKWWQYYINFHSREFVFDFLSCWEAVWCRKTNSFRSGSGISSAYISIFSNHKSFFTLWRHVNGHYADGSSFFFCMSERRTQSLNNNVFHI